METEEIQTDRRRHLRVPLIVFKTGSGTDRHLFGYAQTLSEGGLFIASINPRKIGEQFPVEFTLPGTQLLIRCHCEVVWRREYDPSGKIEPGFGVRFLDLPDGSREAIESWIRDQKG